MRNIVLIYILLSLTACHKTNDVEDVLPQGENTMYCYLNGELYVPLGHVNGGFLINAIEHSICLDDSSFSLAFTNRTLPTPADIKLFFKGGINEEGVITLNEGHYDICQNTNNFGRVYIPNNTSNAYYTRNNSGSVIITEISLDKKQFKGTFEMTVYKNGETKNITNGNFNINLDTLNE